MGTVYLRGPGTPRRLVGVVHVGARGGRPTPGERDRSSRHTEVTTASRTTRGAGTNGSGARREPPVARWNFLGQQVDVGEGEVVRFPDRDDFGTGDDREFTDQDLKEWQAYAYHIWHQAIADYASLSEPEDLLEFRDEWRAWLAWLAQPLADINREIERRARSKRRALLKGANS